MSGMISMNNQFITMMEQVKKDFQIIDLSYTLEETMPVWPTHPRYGAIEYESYDQGGVSMHRMISLGEHSGTHIDAPKHFVKDGKGIDELSITNVMGRGIVIDASNVAKRDVLTVEQIKEFEKKNGEIQKGDIVIVRFGWEEKYALGKDGSGFLTDWPGVSKKAAQYFLDKKVLAVGCDTLSIDAFGVDTYVCHEILLGNNIPIIENMCNLKKLPPVTYIIGLANKFKGGSGSPIRIAAFVESNKKGE